MKKPLFEVRDSPVHGTGVFAARKIKRGTRIIEYTGERISHKEGNRRYEDNKAKHAFVLLFTVNNKLLLDGAVGGSDAKYINHSCDPNCDAVIDDKRVFIEANRTIQKGEELNYDYSFERDRDDKGEWDKLYACRCGSANCRGTMLLAPKKKKKKKTESKGKKKSPKKSAKELKKSKSKDKKTKDKKSKSKSKSKDKDKKSKDNKSKGKDSKRKTGKGKKKRTSGKKK